MSIICLHVYFENASLSILEIVSFLPFNMQNECELLCMLT